MKEIKFLPTLFICYILGILGLFVLSLMSAISFFVLMLAPALFFAVLIHAFIRQEEKIETLEERLAALEEKEGKTSGFASYE